MKKTHKTAYLCRALTFALVCTAFTSVRAGEVVIAGDSPDALTINGIGIGQNYAPDNSTISYPNATELFSVCRAIIIAASFQMPLTSEEKDRFYRVLKELEGEVKAYAIKEYRVQERGANGKILTISRTGGADQVVSVGFDKYYDRTPDDIKPLLTGQFGFTWQDLVRYDPPIPGGDGTAWFVHPGNPSGKVNMHHINLGGLEAIFGDKYYNPRTKTGKPAPVYGGYTLIKVDQAANKTRVVMDSVGNTELIKARSREYVDYCDSRLGELKQQVAGRLATPAEL